MVKVFEITSSELKYHQLDNPDGPLYSDSKTNILKIRYENGISDVFAKVPSETSNPVVVDVQKANTDCKIVQDGPHFYCNGTRISKGEMLMQIKSRVQRLDNIPVKDAYRSYQLNKGLHVDLSLGAMPFFLAGGFFYVFGSFVNSNGGTSHIMDRGIVLLATGGVVEIGTITAFEIKNVRFKQAIKLYNES